MKFPLSKSPISLDKINKSELLDYFNNAWDLYEWLFSAIRDDESYYLSPDPLRNPLIFYLGHTAAFYINKLKLAKLIESGIDTRLDFLFSQGVDPKHADELNHQISWPSVEATRAYRNKVKKLVTDFINAHDWQKNISAKDPQWAILMAIEHDRIHFETSSVLLRQLQLNLVQKPRGWEYAPITQTSPNRQLLKIPGGKISLGLDLKSAKIFGWDNEFGQLNCDVAPFAVASSHITNLEFLEFVEDGGYQNPQYWSAQAWQWITENQRHCPKFWIKNSHKYNYRAMFDELPFPHNWPVEVVYHEALAFCKWLGNDHRLMSEAEWKFLADDACAKNNPNNTFNLHLAQYGSPRAINADKIQGNFGVHDIIGNVWDWVSNDFYPLPGFKIHPLYQDFSQPFFGESHKMMLGGSWASTGTSASKNYRLWFRKEFIQHAGFRLAKSL